MSETDHPGTSGPPPLPGSSPYPPGGSTPPPLPSQAAPPPLPTPAAMPNPAPMPDPGALSDPAVFHSTELTRTYPCRSCGGMLGFDPSVGRLRCASCGTEHDVTDMVAEVTYRDYGSTMAELDAERGADRSGTVAAKEIVCQSCGGHTNFTGTVTAIRCPYCNTPIQRDDLQDAPARLPIDAILPLQVGQAQARDTVEKWISSRWFAPNEFKKYRTLGSFSSVYLPYFDYRARTVTDYSGRRGDRYTVTVGSGDNRRTETRVRWWPASGRVVDQFDQLPTSASSGLDQKKVSELEPWPVQQSVRHNPQFVAGHLSRTYDLDARETFDQRAFPIIDAQVQQTIRHDIGGDLQEIHSHRITFEHLQFAQHLLPTWLLTVTYASKPYQVFINGVTGEVQGERPYSAIKITLAILAAVVVLVIAYLIYTQVSG